MLDSSGRRIHYLRVSVTDRCNLRCTYCMPEEGVPFVPHGRILTFEQIASVVSAAAGLGFDKIRLTGGEPLVRKGIADLVSMLAGIDGIRTLGMTTNGTLLAPVAADLARRGLSSVNVSLDSLDPERYALVTRGGKLQSALEGIRAARAAGLPVKLNIVVGTDGIWPIWKRFAPLPWKKAAQSRPSAATAWTWTNLTMDASSAPLPVRSATASGSSPPANSSPACMETLRWAWTGTTFRAAYARASS